MKSFLETIRKPEVGRARSRQIRGTLIIMLFGFLLGVVFSQTFNITQEFYVYHWLEIPTWLAGVIVLKRKPMEFAIELGLSVAVAFVCELVIPHWG